MALIRLHPRAVPPDIASWNPWLFPHWGIPGNAPERYPYNNVFNRWISERREICALTSLADADFAIVPEPWSDIAADPARLAAAHSFITTAARSGKRTLVWHLGDDDLHLPGDNTILFKPSCNELTLRSHEIAAPFWGADLLDRYPDLAAATLPWTPKPRIGFCGFSWSGKHLHAKSDPLSQFRYFLKGFLHRCGIGHMPPLAGEIRNRVLRQLKRSRRVEVDFKIRDSFWHGHGMRQTPTDQDYAEINRSHREYAANIIGNAYTLCVRGEGNFSIRFFETLGAGRIPVFVNTHCVLPLSHLIPWREICVWVEENEWRQADRRVAEFHRQHSAASLLALHERILAIWREQLSPFGFFRAAASDLLAQADNSRRPSGHSE